MLPVIALLLALAMALPYARHAMAEMAGDAPADDSMGERRPKKPKKFAPTKLPGRSVRPGGLGQAVFKPHLDALDAYFRPMAGNILSVSGRRIASDIQASAKVMPGARFHIMRLGEPFVHPVTGQRVMGTETPVGLAEALPSGNGPVMFSIINGPASPGDVLRITSAPVKVLYYQHPSVDWDVSEEYYYWLVSNERFQVVDAPVGRMSGEALMQYARNEGTDILVMLEHEPLPESPVISNAAGPADEGGAAPIRPVKAVRQRVLRSSDGAVMYTSVMVVDEELLKKLKVAGKMFWPDTGKPALEVEVPFRASIIQMADINCDGKDELVLGTASSLYFYSLDIELRPPFGLEEPLLLKGSARSVNVWLDVLDYDSDGCDELALTSLKGKVPLSAVYKYTGGKFQTLWQGEVFIRDIGGRLYAQKPSGRGGYEGDVFGLKDGAPLALPSGVDIYDFAFINSPSTGQRFLLSYDEQSHMALYNAAGAMVWTSEDSYGGRVKAFSLQKAEDLIPGEVQRVWHVNDRLRSREGDIYAIYRAPRLDNMPGLGFRGSGIIRISGPGTDTKEEVYVRDIPGSATDFIFTDDRLFVLRSAGTVRLMNIFKGRMIFVSKILVYSTEGR